MSKMGRRERAEDLQELHGTQTVGVGDCLPVVTVAEQMAGECVRAGHRTMRERKRWVDGGRERVDGGRE